MTAIETIEKEIEALRKKTEALQWALRILREEEKQESKKIHKAQSCYDRWDDY